ncbi:dienelactone hydrolase family protein [Celerinatantimonas yamalensis]|uniref:Dienelactone hydrolase family protein n=1 Tax=Celerinatantimonas yamalensis TaxID=559956 RepID=A0ABW9G4H0_9GAMM
MQTQVLPIDTMTLSDEQLLSGDAGTPTMIAGVLRLPSACSQPLVVLLHGSSGYHDQIDEWVARFNQQSIATFVIDSFTGRGLSNVDTNQSDLGRLSSIVDAYAALARLCQHPSIDAKKIALMGFSRGGQGALYAAMSRFSKRFSQAPNHFAAFVSFYPNCSFQYIDDTQLVDRPIRIFHGECDDFNPIAASQMFTQRAQQAGADIQLISYPDAQHGFDSQALPERIFRSKSQSTRHCQIIEQTPGQLINQATGNRFSYSDTTIERGTHLGYQAKAAQDAQRRVSEFFKQVFHL